MSGEITITREQAEALSKWAEAHERGKTTGYGPLFDAAFNVARAVRQQVWEPCSDGCTGVLVADSDRFVWPEGYVHVTRCDDCARFPHEQAAAEFLVPTEDVRFVCIECRDEDQRPLNETEANEHEHEYFRVVIPKEAAVQAMIDHRLPPWRPKDEEL